ncbi:MAG: PLP-dependent cysteine synthase family protein [Candidatus Caccovivens sp.]
MKNLKNIKKLVSNTPLVQIEYKFEDRIGKVFAKCEWFSLTGSIKDKVAYQIFYDAYKSGKLKIGDKFVEVSSGNMGISLCAVGNILGNFATIIMPKSMSEERKKLIRLYGANLVEVDDFKSAFLLQEKYKEEGYFCTNQFANISNTKVHREITAKEIFKKLRNKQIDCFVSGVGTSGTLSGIGGFLKEKLHTKIVAIEPANSRVLTGKKPYLHHKIQGISDEIVPELYDENLIDKIIPITDEDAIAMSQKLCQKLSLGVGISSGANFVGAVLAGSSSVTVFADDNKKYLSTDLSKPITTPLVDKIQLLSVKVL